MDEYGKVYINLEELVQEKGISKTQLSYNTKTSHTQINRFCKGNVVRIDFSTLVHLCTVLGCKVSDLIIYEPPKS